MSQSRDIIKNVIHVITDSLVSNMTIALGTPECSDSIILDFRDMLKCSGDEGMRRYYELVASSQDIIYQSYGIRVSKDSVMYDKLAYYGLLFSGLCYVINTETGKKELYTLDEDTLKDMYYDGIIVAKDLKEDASTKCGEITHIIRTGSKIVKTLSRGRDGSEKLNGVHAIRLDKAYHIDDEMWMHYTLVNPTGTLNTSTNVIFPKETLDVCANMLINILKEHCYLCIQGDKVRIITGNEKVLELYYGKERMTKLVEEHFKWTDDYIEVPVLGQSIYDKGYTRVYLEQVDKMYEIALNLCTVSYTKNNPITFTGASLDHSVIHKDVRGAKKFLKGYMNYDSLDDAKKHRLDCDTDTEAYRYIRDKGIKGFHSYGELFGNERVNIQVPLEEKDMRKILESGIFEIELLTKKGKKTLICSSNQAEIERIYGEDYRIYCNSFSSRVSELYRRLEYQIKVGNVEGAKNIIANEMTKKYGITPANLILRGRYLEEPFTLRNIIDALQEMCGNVKESTQNAYQILTTCLTDTKPKNGAGRNLLRSFYLSSVLKITQLK